MSKNKIIGVDIGGTKIETVLMDKNGKIFDLIRIKTEADKGKTQIMKNIFSSINPFFSRHKNDILGIGIGIPGFTDNKGEIIHLPNILALLNTNLEKELKKLFFTNIKIANDALCFSWAEFNYGAGIGTKNMIGLIWGTGVGSGIIINKNLYTGKFGAAGEVGFTQIISDKEAKRLGYKGGVLEYLCGGKQLSLRYKKIGGTIKNPQLAQLGSSSQDKKAKLILNESIEYMSVAIANLYNIFAPDAVVLGGGMSNISKQNYLKLEKSTKNKVLKSLSQTVKIKKYKISDSSGAIGAGALLL